MRRAGLRAPRPYGRVPPLRLARGNGSWWLNKTKDLSFGIDGELVGAIVPRQPRQVHRLLRASPHPHLLRLSLHKVPVFP